MEQLNIRELPDLEKPYEKCKKFGATALSDSELIAVLLRTGTKDHDVLSLSNDIIRLCDNGNNLSKIVHFTENELCKIKGIGKIKAIQIVCMGELAKRISLSKAQKSLSFCNAHTIANYYMERLRHLQQEHFVVAMLDSKNRLIKDKVISIGSVNATIVSPRDIFKEALKYNAVSIIVLHNHPSGDSTPSSEDFDVTHRLVRAGNLLSLQVLDHIVIGDREYYSFKEKGIIT